MGVTYFSGQTLTLDGRTPVPINLDNVTVFIVAGYILSILVMILFGTSVAEGTKHGIFVFYLAITFSGLTIYPLWKVFSYSPFRTFKFLTAFGALGFILAIASLFIPSLSLIASAFLGVGGVCCWLIPLFGTMLRIQYPSRFISPAIIFVAFVGVLIHASLLEAFREHQLILYIIYLVVAVTLVIIYLLLEPYFSYAFNKDGFRFASKKETVENEQKENPKQLTEHSAVSEKQIFEMLSYQETRIADLILSGYSYSEIADVLKIKPNTVKWYQKEIYSKLGINSKRELFAFAAKRDN